MKKFLSIFLVLLLSLSVFAGCVNPGEQDGETEAGAITLDSAIEYLTATYRSAEGKATPADFELVPQYSKDGVTFTITWTVDNANIKVTLDETSGFYVVDVPAKNDTEVTYTLTATVKDTNGNTKEFKMTRVLPVLKDVEGAVSNVKVGEAYKLFMDQKDIGKVLFLLAEASTSENKFIKTTINPKDAPDFFVEEADGGYKIYAMVGSTKTYIRAATVTTDDGKTSKYLGFDSTGTVFKYNTDYNAWYTTIDGADYVMGTYSTYDTASISEDSYYKDATKRATQFAITFISKADGEAMTPTEGPADPTELTSIADVLTIAAGKAHNTYTTEKYLVKGTVSEVANTTYGNLYIKDEAGNTIYIYGMYNNDGTVRFDAMTTQPKVGDVITVMSIVGQFNDTPQLKNAWLMEHEVTVCEHTYSGDCDKKCDKCSTERTVTVEHTYDNACDADCNVCAETRTPAAHVYDNDCDAACNVCNATRTVPDHVYAGDCDTKCNVCEGERTVSVSHTYDNACDADCNVCAETRTPAAHVYSYTCDATCNVCNGTRQAECVDANSDGKCDSCNENMPNAEQIEQNRIAHEKNQLPTFSEVTEDGSVDLPSVGKDYSNVTVVWTSNKACAVIANGKVTFTLGEEEQTVTLTATLTCGSTTDRVTFTIKVAAIPSQEPSVPESNEKKFTIDMLGTTNLTSRTPDKTIYTANSIVYTNDKASSTTDNYNQTGTFAARAYKGSTIKIEFPSMTKIVFILDDYSNGQYLTGFDNMEVTGATITRNNDTVTITFAAATNVFMSAELLSQVRIESIIVYSTADVAGGEEVGDDENAGGDNNNNDDSNGGTTTTLTALTELKNGDVVVIAAPAYNMALSVNKVATFYNAGVDISSGLSELTNAEKFVVTVNGDGSYTFTSVSGVVIALADSYSSLNEDGANKSWTLEAKDDATGVFYVKNTGRGNYLEWYASMNNWSSYTPTSFTPEYELSFYAAE